jgi:hypothetical protein
MTNDICSLCEGFKQSSYRWNFVLHIEHFSSKFYLSHVGLRTLPLVCFCCSYGMFVVLFSACQASWHPGSSSHFAVLASDNRWRLYHTGRLAEAEQTFWLRLPGSQVGVAEGSMQQAGFARQYVLWAPIIRRSTMNLHSEYASNAHSYNWILTANQL